MTRLISHSKAETDKLFSSFEFPWYNFRNDEWMRWRKILCFTFDGEDVVAGNHEEVGKEFLSQSLSNQSWFL